MSISQGRCQYVSCDASISLRKPASVRHCHERHRLIGVRCGRPRGKEKVGETQSAAARRARGCAIRARAPPRARTRRSTKERGDESTQLAREIELKRGDLSRNPTSPRVSMHSRVSPVAGADVPAAPIVRSRGRAQRSLVSPSGGRHRARLADAPQVPSRGHRPKACGARARQRVDSGSGRRNAPSPAPLPEFARQGAGAMRAKPCGPLKIGFLAIVVLVALGTVSASAGGMGGMHGGGSPNMGSPNMGGGGGWHGSSSWHGHGCCFSSGVFVGVGVGPGWWGPWGWGWGGPWWGWGPRWGRAAWGWAAPVVPVSSSWGGSSWGGDSSAWVEQHAPPPQPQHQQQYWYYCQGSQTFFPYVRECPGGWMQVVPQLSPPPPPAPPTH